MEESAEDEASFSRSSSFSWRGGHAGASTLRGGCRAAVAGRSPQNSSAHVSGTTRGLCASDVTNTRSRTSRADTRDRFNPHRGKSECDDQLILPARSAGKQSDSLGMPPRTASEHHTQSTKGASRRSRRKTKTPPPKAPAAWSGKAASATILQHEPAAVAITRRAVVAAISPLPPVYNPSMPFGSAWGTSQMLQTRLKHDANFGYHISTDPALPTPVVTLPRVLPVCPRLSKCTSKDAVHLETFAHPEAEISAQLDPARSRMPRSSARKLRLSLSTSQLPVEPEPQALLRSLSDASSTSEEAVPAPLFLRKSTSMINLPGRNTGFSAAA
jgi:hypothetical protein